MHWRHIKFRNPLRPRTLTFRETLLAKEAAEEKSVAKEKIKVERNRRASLACLEGREAVWPRLTRFLRRIARADIPKSPFEDEDDFSEDQAAAIYGGEDLVVKAVEKQELGQPERVWEGDWTVFLEVILEEDDENCTVGCR